MFSKAKEINSNLGVLSPEPTSLTKTSYYPLKGKYFTKRKTALTKSHANSLSKTFREQKGRD